LEEIVKVAKKKQHSRTADDGQKQHSRTADGRQKTSNLELQTIAKKPSNLELQTIVKKQHS
jgi:hypothetical protein